jgi:hypothetical protein
MYIDVSPDEKFKEYEIKTWGRMKNAS